MTWQLGLGQRQAVWMEEAKINLTGRKVFMRGHKILVTNKISDVGKEKLEELGFQLVWSESNQVKDVKKVISDCDGIIARMTPVRRELMDAAPHLRIIGMHGVGLDGIDVDYATENGIAVTRAAAANCISVAEHVINQMMNLCKKTIPADCALRERNRFQDRDQFIGHDISGKTLGIVGLGRIGKKLAEMASLGFHMRVIAYDPYVSQESMQQVGSGVEKMESIEDVVTQADFLSFHTQLTPEMVGVVNYDLFKKMKPTAYFINEMRGALVNEPDLLRALKEGVIAGAALDVFTQEPTPDGYELFTAPNLIATPHVGASTYESMDRTILTLAEEFRRFFCGEEMEFLVNPDYKKL